MNAVPDHSDIVRATVSLDGLLLSADVPLLRLQLQAGGELGGPFLVPQVAALARLAGRMAIAVSRPVVAAGDNVDIDMWVRAKPDGAHVHVSIIEWRERPKREDGNAAEMTRQADLVRQQAGWAWQIDTRMHFVMVEPVEDAAEDAERPQIGMSLTAWFDLVADDSAELPILQALAEHRPFLTQRAKRREGDNAHYLLSGLPVFDSSGRLIGYRGKARPYDQAILATAQAEAEPVDTTPYAPVFGQRLDLALRQPLGRIIANADTISSQLQGPLRRDYATYASDIAVAGRHLMELVDDLADLQAIERPGFTTASEDVDLADIARRAAGLLNVRASDRHIRIDPPQGDESVMAIGEFRRTLQIMVNLIGNAVRYSPEGSMVWVRVGLENGDARAVVADQGRGISAEDQERIFEKFERLGRDEAGGSGLGLYISRQLASAMGGSLTVDSAPGQGARFTLALPAKPDSPDPA